MFLTQGITAKFADYHDPRTHNIPTGVNFVLSIGILVRICIIETGVDRFVDSHSNDAVWHNSPINRVCAFILKIFYAIQPKWRLSTTEG